MKKVKSEKLKPSSHIPARTMGIAIIVTIGFIVAVPILYALGATVVDSLKKQDTTNIGVVKTVPTEELKNAGTVEANPQARPTTNSSATTNNSTPEVTSEPPKTPNNTSQPTNIKCPSGVVETLENSINASQISYQQQINTVRNSIKMSLMRNNALDNDYIDKSNASNSESNTNLLYYYNNVYLHPANCPARNIPLLPNLPHVTIDNYASWPN